MTAAPTLVQRVEREIALLLLLLLAGLVLLPVAIFLVGDAIFGDYPGAGFAGFYASLHGELRQGDPAVWFLVAVPYLAWQTLRLTGHVFRRAKP